MKLPVYLDYQATTPTDPRVVDAMLPFFTENFGNPHSTVHAYGQRAKEAVAAARLAVAGLIGADAKEIIFTSGATEANNLALKGCMALGGGGRNHLVVGRTEHPSVLETCRLLANRGIEVTYLSVGENGLIDLDEFRSAIGARTLLVSIMAVNNEIGVIQPLREIGSLCRGNGVLFHTDAAQAEGKIELDVNGMAIDLLSLSGHKMYGPKGIGALYVRRRPRVRLDAQIVGGGQERGIRAGSVPTPLVVGLGKACTIAGQEMADEGGRLRFLRDRFLAKIRNALSDVFVNGDLEQRIPGNLNLGFRGVESAALIRSMPDLAISAGSACTSTRSESSHVLHALGVGEERAKSSIRLGFGRYTTQAEVDFAAGAVIGRVEALRRNLAGDEEVGSYRSVRGN